MAVVASFELAPIVDDPDDYRPESRWALVTDPGDAAGRADLTLIVEEIAPGDRIPLHRHQVDELLLVDAGELEVRIGDSARRADAGAAVFIPAGAVHGSENVGAVVARVRAIFPGTRIEMEMLDRNPAPGTEGRPPSHVEYDARSGAFRVIT